MSTYALDNASEHARRRLPTLEAVFDPGTIRVLTERGVGEGWRCAEVGAGAGSIAVWLSANVGTHGRVLATDIDPRYLEPLRERFPNLEVRRHDIVAEDLPGGPFDLVHARLVLEHLPGRAEALRRMVDALAPGGWLVVESIEFETEWPDPAIPPPFQTLWAKHRAAERRLLADRGFDHHYARGLATRLRAADLLDVGTDGRAALWTGGDPGAILKRQTVEQLREQHVAGGYLTPDEVDAIVAMLGDPAFATTSPMIMAAWGRRPPAG